MEEKLLQTLALLEGNLDKMVLVGGWCPFIYTRYLWNAAADFPSTTDIDLGVMETGGLRYPATIYDKLKQAGLAMKRIFEEEPEPVDFVWREGGIKIEFITSFLTSDDTLNRFLGKNLACHRIEAFEILLKDPLQLAVPYLGKVLKVQIPPPGTFLYHKGISFVMRGHPFKRDKDLYYVYFILQHCPDKEELFDSVRKFRTHEFHDVFVENLKSHLTDYAQPGFAMIRKFLSRAADERTLYKQIKDDMEEFLSNI